MEARLEKVIIKNFGAFRNFEVEFKGSVTRLIGVNGSGKTTIGHTAIVTALKGIAERSTTGQIIGKRYQFIGPDAASADTIVHIKDTKANALIEASNHLTKSAGNSIKFRLLEGPVGYVIDEAWMKGLLNASLMSAKAFCSLSSKEQALEIGIDVSEHDKKIKEIKAEYTILNRDAKKFGEIVVPEKVEKVSTEDLFKELKAIEDFNKKQNELADKKKTIKESAIATFDRIKEYQTLLLEAEDKLSKLAKMYIETPNPEDYKEATEINDKIKNADSINDKYNAYNTAIERKKEKDAVLKKIEANRSKLSTKEKERNDVIKAFNLPFQELSINFDGELLFNDRPIKEPYFSHGEREKIVAGLAASTNPDLKLRFLDDFNLVDEDNQEKLINSLTSNGFSLIIADVGKEAIHDNSILIKEGAIVDSY